MTGRLIFHIIAVNNNHHLEEINEEEENDNTEDELSEMVESTAEPELLQPFLKVHLSHYHFLLPH